MNQTMKVKQQQFSAYKAGNIWPTGHARRYQGNFQFVYGTRLKYVKLGCGFCFDNETGFGSADDLCPVCHGAGYLAKMYRYRPWQNRRIKKKISYPCPEGYGTEREFSYCGGCGCNGTGRLYVALK